LERDTGNKLLKHRSDGGGERTRNALKSFLEQEGIKQKLIKPYTQKQNGIAEREIRTTVESVRCMLHGHSISLKFWGSKAIQIAVYV